jgi:putative ABC transport system ATP-binding protein
MPSNGNPTAAIETRGVVKVFGKGENRTVALKGVDFSAQAGEMMMIVGPSGCGKTTLLSVICGTLSFDEGEVHVFGQNLADMRDSAITAFRGQHVGFIFQQFNLIPTWTALENVSVPLLLNNRPRREAEEAAARVLREVGLGEKLRSYPRELSGGQQQRVAIARALVHQPRLIICDEPTAALDAASGHKVVELLKEVACHPERCVIVVTHDSRIFRFADRIAEMEDGVVKVVHGKGEYHAQYV